jgi:hypothetical protein
MFIKILIGLLIVLGLVAMLIASRPSAFRVTRSMSIAAAPSAIFPLVNDFRNWPDWSPWDKFDPNMTKTYEGPPKGVGAVYRWSGNKHVGEGSTTITESKPNELVRMRLQFVRPFRCDNPVEFRFQPAGNETLVTWSMTGDYNFVTKAMGLVVNMDKMTGDQFTEGLTNLKRIAEGIKEPAGASA